MDTTSCPECGMLAEVEWRAVLESTDGPIEHAKVRCVQKHWFLLPVAALAAAKVSEAEVARETPPSLPLRPGQRSRAGRGC